MLSSAVTSVPRGCLSHGERASAGETGGKLMLALLWRHLAAQVSAGDLSALLLPQPHFRALLTTPRS